MGVPLSLTGATSGAYGILSYTYDEIGNMKTNTRVAGEYKYMQDGNTRPHAIARTGTGPVWSYDANGNVTNDGTRSISWNRDNKPRTIGSVTFTYDYAGKRAMKASGGSTIRYVSEMYECKSTDAYCTMYIFGAGKRIASKTTQASPVTRYYHKDHLGSTSLVTRGNGTVDGTAYYYPYGETRTAESNPPSSVRYRYTDQEMDTDTGLYNYVARHYDPVVGRFMSPDSIVPDYADPQSLNRYSYVLNNPMKYTDPTGQYYAEMNDSDWLYWHYINDPWMLDIGTGSHKSSVSVDTHYATQNVDEKSNHQTAGMDTFYGDNAGNPFRYQGILASQGLLDHATVRSLIGGISGGLAAELYGRSFGGDFQSGAVTAGIGAVANNEGYAPKQVPLWSVVAGGNVQCWGGSYGRGWRIPGV